MKRPLIGIAAVLFWLAVWAVAAWAIGSELLLPAPWTVAGALIGLMGKGKFWLAVAASLARVLIGFAAGVAAGALLAALTAASGVARALIAPFLRLLRTAPVASFIILFMVWFRSDVLPAVIAFAMVTPLVWEALTRGIDAADRSLLEMAAVYRFGWRHTLTRVWLPTLRPYLLTACVSGLGFAWKSGVAAEVLCLPALAVGTGLKEAKSALEIAEVIAWTAVVVALSAVMEGLVKRLTEGRRAV